MDKPKLKWESQGQNRDQQKNKSLHAVSTPRTLLPPQQLVLQLISESLVRHRLLLLLRCFVEVDVALAAALNSN